ncbi:unnamed protein product, partial [marine sediment metagenome]
MKWYIIKRLLQLIPVIIGVTIIAFSLIHLAPGDPADVTDGESISRTDNIFESLVEYTSGGTDIQSALATSWDTSDDGLEITFDLRKNVEFHDGTD